MPGISVRCYLSGISRLLPLFDSRYTFKHAPTVESRDIHDQITGTSDFKARGTEEEVESGATREMSEGGQTNVREIQQDEKQKSVSPTTNNSSENLSHDTLDGDIDTVIISKFWKFLNELNAERPDLSLQEFLGIVENIVNLLLNWNPDNFEYLNRLFELTYQKCKDFSGDGVVIDSPDIALLLRNLMTLAKSPQYWKTTKISYLK